MISFYLSRLVAPITWYNFMTDSGQNFLPFYKTFSPTGTAAKKGKRKLKKRKWVCTPVIVDKNAHYHSRCDDNDDEDDDDDKIGK